LRFSLFELPAGAEPRSGRGIAYDLGDGRSLVWDLAEDGWEDALLSVEVELDPTFEWLMRHDRVDFPPGGVAYRHTHPGPGIRYLLFGSLHIDSHGRTYEPGEAWFEGAGEPVLATASAEEDSAFVRVLLLPHEWAGKRTIRYLDPADEEKPKLQRATVFLEQPIAL
jgi:quercetin dioxygenase-like cupin family protein